MPPRLPTVRLSTLVLQDLRALPRHAFGLGAVGALLILAAVFAYAAAHGQDGFQIYLFFTWVAAPLLVAVALATRIAAARRSRFVDSLFTTPLSQPTWLAAQVVVGVALVLGVMLAASPFALVYLWHLPAPVQLRGLLAAGLCVGAFAVALGVFCGVIVGDAGPGAAGSLAGGGAVAAVLGFIAEGTLAGSDAAAAHPLLLRLAHVSPVALALDATGTTSIIGIAPDSGWGAAVGLAVMIAFLGIAAWHACTRQQGPLGWESQRGVGARWAIVVLAAAALLVPVAAASVSYHEAGDRERFFLEGGDEVRANVAPRGAAITDESITPLSAFRQDSLVFGQDNARDALVVLRVPTNATVSSLRVAFESSGAFDVQGGLNATPPAPAGRAHETRGFGFPGDPVGEERDVYRVPIVVRPTSANALLESRATLKVHVSYVADGVAHDANATLVLTSDIPGAGAQVLAASAPLPLACAGGLVARKLRTR